ncbi:MAG: hypothetical protein JWM68_818, partial [Verrucomicrobiales bacterium]|nr:hypothetical protein [Verrucomicrobiales bacterium]
MVLQPLHVLVSCGSVSDAMRLSDWNQRRRLQPPMSFDMAVSK